MSQSVDNPDVFNSSNPLFLGSSDNPNLVLVSNVFNGIGFSAWKRSISIFLLAKNKFGLVDGTIAQPLVTSPSYSSWNRVNSMVISWILNSLSKNIADSVLMLQSAHEIWQELNQRYEQYDGALIYHIHQQLYSLSQNSDDFSSYFTKLTKMWDELRIVQGLPACSCGTAAGIHKFLEDQRLIQLLMGLNDSYKVIRGQILMMKPLPSVATAYSMIIQEEQQLNINLPSSFTNEVVTMNMSVASSIIQNKKPLACNQCKKNGHSKAQCYLLIGFPANFKFTKSKQDDVKSSIQNIVSTPNISTEQYQNLVEMLPQLKNSDASHDTTTSHVNSLITQGAMNEEGLNLKSFLIPLKEIIQATKNFSPKGCIGGGGFGKVYRGELSERWQNRTAAIKRLDKDSYQGEHEFRNEVKMISRFHHENIISFIGYCDEGKEMIIVYEYAYNGSLDHHLQDPKKMHRLSWMQRLKICIGAARGLSYLHSGLGEDNRVIHRDVKSANILLDDNFVAKICDFGLSRVGPRNQSETQIYTKAAGTLFYLDPTYHESAILRKESDVYSFGVVMFEMLSGMLVYLKTNDRPQSLMHFVRRYHHNELHKIIDPDIKDFITSRSFDKFTQIAYQCVSFSLPDRPLMDTVVMGIEEAFGIHDSVAILIECVMEDNRFSHGKPVSAFTLYKCLLHWKYFEEEKTTLFDQIVQIIISATEGQNNNNQIAFWLSNVSTLLFLVQKSLKHHSASSVPGQPPGTSLSGRNPMGFHSSVSSVDLSEAEAALNVVQQVEAKYPAYAFVQKLTIFVEKMYGIICDNLKKELEALLALSIQTLQTSKGVIKPVQSFNKDFQFSNWQGIVDRLNSLLHILKDNFVPPIIVQKIFSQNFSYINVQLFNSLLLHGKCCSLSNVEYVKAGLTKLELWCSQVKDEVMLYSEISCVTVLCIFMLEFHILS
ncbi:unnamed protein product [Lactuca virosa]|uniref:non-specific serine/threonine protein kinase n=1 Tax=Lactuca virosa TaxID=75947 RepID=A0AAU9NR54_9ASTR|nr:unnamed protein product [Lactuca virosa]